MTRDELRDLFDKFKLHTMCLGVNKTADIARPHVKETEAALLAEFDRLRDCERVVWCLSVGHTLWFKKFGRAGHETIRMWVGVHTMTREPHYELHRWDGKEFHTYSLGPNFSISESADPDRVRAIIDQEMAKETGK